MTNRYYYDWQENVGYEEANLVCSKKSNKEQAYKTVHKMLECTSNSFTGSKPNKSLNHVFGGIR